MNKHERWFFGLFAVAVWAILAYGAWDLFSERAMQKSWRYEAWKAANASEKEGPRQKVLNIWEGRFGDQLWARVVEEQFGDKSGPREFKRAVFVVPNGEPDTHGIHAWFTAWRVEESQILAYDHEGRPKPLDRECEAAAREQVKAAIKAVYRPGNLTQSFIDGQRKK